MRPSGTRDVEDIYQLSPLQQGMLFHELAEPGSGLYMLHRGYELTGPLSSEIFLEAWQRAVSRHPPLRTSFNWKDVEVPVQIVYGGANRPPTVGDWSDVAEGELAERIEALAQEMLLPFDFEKAPLVRVALMRLSADRHYFALTFHHILMEGWSVEIILSEVFAECGALMEGRVSTIPTRRPFRDYILWLTQQDRSAAETFWTRAMRGFSAPTPLLARFEPDAAAGATTPEEEGPGKTKALEQAKQQDSRYVELRARLTEPDSAALRSLAQLHGITLNTVVQGAWAIVLSRYTGEDDTVFGSTVSGRSAALEGVDEMVGLFVNTLPARVRVRRDQLLVPWLKSIQTDQVAARAFEGSSLIDIHGWSEVPRTSALFESILVFSNWLGGGAGDGVSSEGGLEVSDRYSSEGGTGYPITVSVAPSSSLQLTLSFDEGRLEREGCRRVLRHLQTILESIAGDSQKPVGALEMLPTDERETILARNPTDSAYPRDRGIHQLFEERVEDQPDRVAAVFGDASLRYRELDERANQLAHHLVDVGVGEGDLVALCVDRSLDMLVALLAIMKSGGAYVPIEPALPADRIAYMVSDAGVRFLVTTDQNAAWLPVENTTIVRIDTDAEAIRAHPSTTPSDELAANSLAYVIYTSGSTGRPKGVEIEHRSFANFLCAMQDLPGFGPEDTILAITTICFDISGLELFLPLIAGGTVVIADQDTVSDGRALAEEISRREITVLQATPATWRLLLDSGWEGQTNLKALCGGEALPLDLAGRLAECCGQLWNMYGPTETTIWSTLARIDPGVSTVSIGRPIANTQVYVLDEHMELVPDGVAGNLYIGGDGLARGYRNRPSLTAERFVDDSSGRKGSGKRLYHTGDLARFLDGGELECLGRSDHQVKIHGFRIEPGEIESVLSQHEAIRENAVIARSFGPGDDRLVAYVVFERQKDALASELRRFLRKTLPEYMMPRIFHTMDSLPLTPGAKVDRNALPNPEGFTTRESVGRPPQSPTEKMVAEMWQGLLEIDTITAESNFFDLGGHSLLAMQVAVKVEKTLGQWVNPLKLAFLTLGQFAHECDLAAGGTATASAPQGQLSHT